MPQKLPARDSELLKVLDQGFAHSAHVAGEQLVCRAGCTDCCHGAFRINALDAARLAAGMAELRIQNPDLAESIAARAKAWLAEFSVEFPGDPLTGILGTSVEDLEKFDEFAPDAPCPALNTESGLCEVYAWRPMTCRVFGPPVRVDAADYGANSDVPAFAHCQLCFTNADTALIEASELHLPHELESDLLAQLADSSHETVVAFALLKSAG